MFASAAGSDLVSAKQISAIADALEVAVVGGGFGTLVDPGDNSARSASVSSAAVCCTAANLAPRWLSGNARCTVAPTCFCCPQLTRFRWLS